MIDALGPTGSLDLEPIGSSSNDGNGKLYRVRTPDTRRRLADGTPSTNGEYPPIIFITASALRRREAAEAAA
ncbi:MAG: hypothetical protein AAF567_24340 [Actinomycetota bacterium]